LYPSDEILERALHHGIKVTFGSDTHTPGRVDEDFEQVRWLLKEIGFTEWAFFRQKEDF
jgi:histidinol-phosphatase (PHP family)